MSHLSFDTYISKAREGLEGTIRIAKGDPNEKQLVNKGTFGNKVASFFDSIGRAIGSLFGDQQGTRTERNQKALEGFREALVKQFGETVGNEALRLSGLDQDGVKLTGKKIIEVSDLAKFKMSVNRSHNTEMLKDCLPLDYGDDYVGGKFFGEICENLGVSPDLAKTLPPERYEAYCDRLISAFRDQSGLHGRALSSEESKEIATGILKQVLKLDQIDGGLERAQKAREDMKQSVMDLIVDIANGRSPRKVMESLVALDQCLKTAKQTEGFKEEDLGARLRDQVILDAIVELNGHDGRWLSQAQEKIFGKESTVRALYTTLEQAGIGMIGDTGGGAKVANSLGVLLGDIVSGLEKGGSHTGNDSRQLDDQQGLGRRTMERTQQVVLSQLDTLNDAKPFLEGLKRDFPPPEEPDGAPLWNSTEVLNRLEEGVVNYLTDRSVTMMVACDDFRKTIEKDPDLPQDLKNKLYAGLQALETEARLTATLQDVEQYSNIDPEKMWKLFMVGESKWDLEQYNQGSLAGLQRSFEFMLSSFSGEPKTEVTSDYLEQLHILGTEGSFRPSLSLSYRGIDSVDESRLVPGFREGFTSLVLDEGKVTPSGLQQLKDGQNRGYKLTETNSINLSFPPETTRQDCIDRANAILETYRNGIAGEDKTPDDKLLAIANAIQDLYASHLFVDGNTRTVVVNLMNRMLLDNGLSPCVLSDPKSVVYGSLGEFVEQIKQGQERFQELKI